jgi:hypothetical protein
LRTRQNSIGITGREPLLITLEGRRGVSLTELLHHGEELDDDLGGGLEQDLALPTLLGVVHVLEGIVEDADPHHGEHEGSDRCDEEDEEEDEKAETLESPKTQSKMKDAGFTPSGRVKPKNVEKSVKCFCILHLDELCINLRLLDHYIVRWQTVLAF